MLCLRVSLCGHSLWSLKCNFKLVHPSGLCSYTQRKWTVNKEGKVQEIIWYITYVHNDRCSPVHTAPRWPLGPRPGQAHRGHTHARHSGFKIVWKLIIIGRYYLETPGPGPGTVMVRLERLITVSSSMLRSSVHKYSWQISGRWRRGQLGMKIRRNYRTNWGRVKKLNPYIWELIIDTDSCTFLYKIDLFSLEKEFQK